MVAGGFVLWRWPGALEVATYNVSAFPLQSCPVPWQVLGVRMMFNRGRRHGLII